MADAYLAEVAATARFDWLLIDGEHAPNDLRSTSRALQAIAPYPSHPVVRVPQGDTAPDQTSARHRRQVAAGPHGGHRRTGPRHRRRHQYPPQGVRGVGCAVARSSLWTSRADYMDIADDEICLLVQAETVTAMQNLPDICAVDGVHGVFIGPATCRPPWATAATRRTRGAGGHRQGHRHHRGQRRRPAFSRPTRAGPALFAARRHLYGGGCGRAGVANAARQLRARFDMDPAPGTGLVCRAAY